MCRQRSLTPIDPPRWPLLIFVFIQSDRRQFVSRLGRGERVSHGGGALFPLTIATRSAGQPVSDHNIVIYYNNFKRPRRPSSVRFEIIVIRARVSE